MDMKNQIQMKNQEEEKLVKKKSGFIRQEEQDRTKKTI